MITNHIMIVDHDRLFAAALSALVGQSTFLVTHLVSSLDDALTAVSTGAQPGIVILAQADGAPIEAVRRLLALTEARLVVLADGNLAQGTAFALAIGAEACLDKGVAVESLLRTLHLVTLGELVFPRLIADLLPSAPPNPVPAGAESTLHELSPREIQILRCLLAGQSNKAIARDLRITESTVKMHFKNLMRKINAQNRTQAAIWAVHHGLAPMVGA